jgi:hypothetical protein
MKPAVDAHLLVTTDNDLEWAFRAAVEIIERDKPRRERRGVQET